MLSPQVRCLRKAKGSRGTQQAVQGSVHPEVQNALWPSHTPTVAFIIFPRGHCLSQIEMPSTECQGQCQAKLNAKPSSMQNRPSPSTAYLPLPPSDCAVISAVSRPPSSMCQGRWLPFRLIMPLPSTCWGGCCKGEAVHPLVRVTEGPVMVYHNGQGRLIKSKLGQCMNHV